jgi:hypothetical protein
MREIAFDRSRRAVVFGDAAFAGLSAAGCCAMPQTPKIAGACRPQPSPFLAGPEVLAAWAKPERYFDAHSLHIWDHTWPATISEGPVTIERCTGRTANDSGLAVTLRRGARSAKNCLLPGDAAYAYIPSVSAGGTYNALCMTHHGGRLHSAVYPKPKRGAASVLSAGPRNSYRHPMFSTLAAHLEYGWKFPTGTAVSGQRPCHVLVPWGSHPHIFQGGCHGRECATAIAAIAPSCPEVHSFAHPAAVKMVRTLVTA